VAGRVSRGRKMLEAQVLLKFFVLNIFRNGGKRLTRFRGTMKGKNKEIYNYSYDMMSPKCLTPAWLGPNLWPLFSLY
jgi:hypothetical protein